MKPVAEWDEPYILSLPSGEHDWVEFKGSRALDFTVPNVDENKVLDTLSAQLSAFANSGGGTIVYGVNDPAVGQPRTVSEGGVSLAIRGRSTKEWLEDVIPHLVEYPLASFNVYVLTNSGTGTAIQNGRGIFLVQVADSESAPHQARDKKYYARVGGKSRPIGHRLIMDIMGRSQHPKMKLFISRKRTNGESWEWSFYCSNEGKVFANYVNGYVYLPSQLTFGNIEVDRDGIKYTSFPFSNIHKDLIDTKFLGLEAIHYHTTRYNPVLPGLGFSFTKPARIPVDDMSHHKIYWAIYADNAPLEDGETLVREVENTE